MRRRQRKGDETTSRSNTVSVAYLFKNEVPQRDRVDKFRHSPVGLTGGHFSREMLLGQDTGFVGFPAHG